MTSEVETRFREILERTLIPQFCEGRDFKPAGFRSTKNCLTEIDIANFLRAWDGNLIRHIGGGHYRTPRSGASEQFFWEGLKKESPRTFTLWIEPLITVAVLARLHFDFGWPRDLLGCQSEKSWAFDLVAYASDGSVRIACEVKKTTREVDRLLDHVAKFSIIPDYEGLDLKGVEQNSYRKVVALKKLRAPIFLAVGPNCYEKAFEVRYSETEVVDLEARSIQILTCFPN